MNNVTPSYFAIIPANVRYDKNLSPSSKLLYGEITALTQKEGYCWAENRYFADLYDVDIRTVSRWLSDLEENKYIEIDHESRGSRDVRKISIIHFSKGMTKMSQPHDKNVQPPGQKCPSYNNEEKDKYKKTTTTEEVVVFSCMKDLGIPQDLQQKLSSDHPEAKCIELVRRFHAWKTKDSPEAAIFTLLKRWDTWDATPSKQEQKKAEEGQKMTIVESNKQWAKNLYEKIKSKLHDARIFIVDETRIQINNLKGAVQSFGYLEQNLQQIVNGFLRQMEIAV